MISALLIERSNVINGEKRRIYIVERTSKELVIEGAALHQDIYP